MDIARIEFGCPVTHAHAQRPVELHKQLQPLVPTWSWGEIPVMKMEEPNKERKAAIHGLIVPYSMVARYSTLCLAQLSSSSIVLDKVS